MSLKGIFRYRCRRDPGKLYKNLCHTYLTKDQHPPSNLVVCSTIQCSTIEIMNDIISSIYQKTPRPSVPGGRSTYCIHTEGLRLLRPSPSGS